MNEEKRTPPRSVRLEPDVSEWIKSRAKESDRSVSAEINRILKQAKEAESEGSKQGATA